MKKVTSFILLIALLFSLFVAVPTNVSAAGFTPRLTAPDRATYSSGNPFQPFNGNCTWYAWGRAREILGYAPNLQTSGANANQWWQNNINRVGYAYGQTPKLGAIACWNVGGYGHVAVVEKIEADGITFSESH